MPENIQKIIKNILNDIRVDLTDEFDQNFERQAFFSKEWQRRKSPTRPGGHILVDTAVATATSQKPLCPMVLHREANSSSSPKTNYAPHVNLSISVSRGKRENQR